MENLRSVAYSSIKENIINCTYAPGTFLDTAFIVQELGMSRTPVREAITKLEQEGLVQIVSQKGVLIQNMTLKNIRDVYTTREMIEPQMILMYGKDIPKKELEDCLTKLKGNMENLPLKDVVELDDLLHKVIMYASDNTFIISLFHNLCDQNRRIQYMTRSLTDRRKQNQDGHIIIVELMLQEKFEEASEMMREHLKTSMEDAFKYMMSH
ncbi:MAG: GntR family transcriptional regulator [Lachnospiraceae bacterium]|nr:GntR family transcriptional regulator [Lachnospiraceae bacterium]